jgi:hypothetical protein
MADFIKRNQVSVFFETAYNRNSSDMKIFVFSGEEVSHHVMIHNFLSIKIAE